MYNVKANIRNQLAIKGKFIHCIYSVPMATSTNQSILLELISDKGSEFQQPHDGSIPEGYTSMNSSTSDKRLLASIKDHYLCPLKSMAGFLYGLHSRPLLCAVQTKQRSASLRLHVIWRQFAKHRSWLQSCIWHNVPDDSSVRRVKLYSSNILSR